MREDNNLLTTNAVPTIPLPSADLIVYRFDQMDKRMEGLATKLDKLTTTFITKEEAYAMKEERDAKFREIEKRLDNWQWYWRALISAVFLAFATSIAALVLRGGG